MGKYVTSWTAPAVMLLLSVMNLGAWADGVCTARAPTAVEKKMYGDAYALFVRAAPPAPDGWQATDDPRTGNLPLLCVESGNAPIRRHFDRAFHLERGRQERDDRAVQAYSEQIKTQQAKAAANKAAVDSIDAKINVIIAKTQKAAAAQKFDEIEPLNIEMDKLMKQKAALMGYDDIGAQTAKVEAEQSRDTEASFSLRFDAPSSEPPDGTALPHRCRQGTAHRVRAEGQSDARRSRVLPGCPSTGNGCRHWRPCARACSSRRDRPEGDRRVQVRARFASPHRIHARDPDGRIGFRSRGRGRRDACGTRNGSDAAVGSAAAAVDRHDGG